MTSSLEEALRAAIRTIVDYPRPGYCFVIDLPDLGGRARLEALDVPVRTLVSFDGH